jgi:hypothetical protein
MIIYGEVPKKIAYFKRDPCKVHRGWVGFDDLDIAPPITATPAFAVDASSKDGRETAARWAGKGSTVQELDNDPIKAVEILSLEKRQEGGRAYKVRLQGVLDGTLYVDMREDVVLDALLASGAKKGGILEGPFVWGRNETQLRLVRVASTLHAAMLQAAERKATKDLTQADYELGGVYLTRKLDVMVYLGKCDVDDIVETKKAEDYPSRKPAQYGVKLERGVNAWVTLRAVVETEADREKIEPWAEAWARMQDPTTTCGWTCRVVKKPALIRQVGKVKVDFEKYSRAVAKSSEHALKMQNRDERCHDYKRLLFNYRRDATLAAHVRPAGEPRPDHPEYEEIWASVTP